MAHLKIAVIYFSATHVTKGYAGVIHAELTKRGCLSRQIDVTPFSARQTVLPVEEFDAFIFGFPVFADFAPGVINEWLPLLDGKDKACAMFFTYGGRTTAYAHFHTLSLLKQAGFRVQFSAEFLGRHSFNVAGWHALPDRPNAQDFVVARQFAVLAIERFSNNGADGFTLQKPFAYDHAIEAMRLKERSPERGWTHPVRSGECSLCGICETECPTQAIDSQTGLSDPLKCIECMHCVYVCPDRALTVDDRMKDAYQSFLKDWNLTEEMMEQKQSKIITAAWQAVF